MADHSNCELPWQERTTRLAVLARGEGYALEGQHPGVEAFSMLLRTCLAGHRSLPEELVLHNIHFNAFSNEVLSSLQNTEYWSQLSSRLGSVTSLDISISVTKQLLYWVDKGKVRSGCALVLRQGILKRFLQSARNVKKLVSNLGEDCQDKLPILLHGEHTASTIGDVIPLDHP
ncbi:hypothetical protein BDV96DRAFT_199422 [Lophiotrema nucula]|uniref:Uncharacterized protein n=1 Tax=Lophiotrema nucula TaxID=690887 RepID=A0A6A5YUU6_9PLEO|nr:hypothetical protein BDV96DRAFT_199422 [Lophiotrema nucula]